MAEKASIILSAEDRTRAAFASLKNNLKGVEQQSVALSGALAGIVPALTAGGLAVFAKQGIDAADSLNDMSQRLKVSVRDLASFKLAADLSDTSLEGVGKGISRLTRSIGEAESGNKQLAQTLQTLGVTARDPKEAFFQLADAVQRIQDPSQRAALLSQVLGKNYEELVPLLEQGGDALRKSAQESESFADAMERLAPNAAAFNDQLDKLKNNAALASANVLNQLLPSLNEWIGSTDTLIERHGVLLGLLSSLGAATVPGITASQLAGSVTPQAFTEELDKAKKELATIRAAQKSDTFGVIQLALYGSRAGMERQRIYLESQIATLESSLAQFRERQQAANKAGSGAAGDSTAQIACVASGGTWDGKRCISKKTTGNKADPIAGLLAGTDIGKLAEFDKQVALLNARFDSGRKNTELYEQAMTKLVETAFDDNFKQFADDQEFMNLVLQDGQNTINETNRSTEEWKATVAATSKELLYMVNPTARLIDQLEELDKFDGFMDPELLAAARLEINAQIDSVTGLGKEIDKTKSFGEEFGLTMKSAFEDAVIEGKDLRDVLAGIGSDLQRIVLRKTITEPLGNAFSGLLDGIDFGSLFSFANGGVMTGSGPLPLHAYARGGVASSPQLALFGEGRMNEAFVPLPDGRRIPVDMRGGGGGNVQVNIIESPGNGGKTEQRQDGNGGNVLDIYVEQIKASIAGDISRGRGAVPDALAGAYGLNRVAGAY